MKPLTLKCCSGAGGPWSNCVLQPAGGAVEEAESLLQEDGGDCSPAAAPHLPAAHPGGVGLWRGSCSGGPASAMTSDLWCFAGRKTCRRLRRSCCSFSPLFCRRSGEFVRQRNVWSGEASWRGFMGGSSRFLVDYDEQFPLADDISLLQQALPDTHPYLFYAHESPVAAQSLCS